MKKSEVYRIVLTRPHFRSDHVYDGASKKLAVCYKYGHARTIAEALANLNTWYWNDTEIPPYISIFKDGKEGPEEPGRIACFGDLCMRDAVIAKSRVHEWYKGLTSVQRRAFNVNDFEADQQVFDKLTRAQWLILDLEITRMQESEFPGKKELREKYETGEYKDI